MRFLPLLVSLAWLFPASTIFAQALPGTSLLTAKEDLAKVMVEGIEKYLDRALAASVKNRQQYWKPDYSSLEKYEKSVSPNRERLKKILGVVDQRLPVTMEYVGNTEHPALIAETADYKVFQVRWPVLPGVFGEGLMLEPKRKVKAQIIVLPDADQTPEHFVFPLEKAKDDAVWQIARHLAEQDCRVVVPVLVDRQDTWAGNPRINRFTNQPHREFIYRMAYEMGRHLIGYETQKVLAVVDWFTKDKNNPPVGIYGYGEGGLIAWISGGVDTRIHTTCVGGYVGPHLELGNEPIYRNVWGLLKEFGQTEMAALVAPRQLILEVSPAPDIQGPPTPKSGRSGAAPGKLVRFGRTDAEAMRTHWKNDPGPLLSFIEGKLSQPPYGFSFLAMAAKLFGNPKVLSGFPTNHEQSKTRDQRVNFDPAPRQKRQFDQLVDYTQKLMPEAVRKRQSFFWDRLDTSGSRLDARLEKFAKSQEPLRKYFWEEIIGKLPEPTMPLNPRTRLLHATPKYKAYEVVLDVYEEVISFGILCVPSDLKPGEKRPCIVCQHGLEGRPTDVVNPKEKTRHYNSFGSQLADMGFVVFAPQNPYIFHNQFRQLVRRAHPLQLSLYAFIVRQHQRILDFLETLPCVDARRIAYYGLSYGGKVAMRIPAILTRYCLSICSGDFNEWIWKNITLDWAGSYMFTGEYEMYEFDLANTFNYAEMAALIAPRPFMVERGHSDGVGLDEYVAFEYAKVRRLYAQLGISDRTEIEFFSGGHEIHLQGTLAFMRKHLQWK